MGREYRQLDLDERVKLGMLKAGGKSMRQIAEVLGRSHSTVVREFKRNGNALHGFDYLAHHADALAEKRKRLAGRRERGTG